MSQAEQLDHAAQQPEPARSRSGAARELALRVEEASLNAWPATSQLVLDGWLIRFAQGFTKRANSVVPLYPGTADLADKIRFCENLYARERLKTIFRITSIDDHDDLDACLAGRGYRFQDPTDVLEVSLAASLETPHGTASLPQQQPLQAWLDTYARLTGLPPGIRPLHQAILRNIPLPCCHAIVGRPDDPVACGLGVLQQDLVGLFDVVTRADARRAGHGEALVAGLIDWAKGQGARTAYLQVAADNGPALALYRKLGFRQLYRYWYRVSG